MTKSQELQILTDTITKLGKDSYLGDWLASVKLEVEQMVKSDIFPDMTFSESKALADKVLKEAKVTADKKVADAQVQAQKIIDGAEDRASRTLQGLREVLLRCSREVDKY